MNYWVDKFGMPDVESYAQLRRHYDGAERWRGSQDRPFGHKKYGSRRMRMLDDQSIELEYHKHPLVRWHPDGTISVFPHQQQRQGVFDSQALPKGFRCDMATRNGPVLLIFPNGCIEYWLTVPKGPDEKRRWEGDDVHYVRNDKFIALKGDKWLHLKREGDTWVPVDESSLTPFKWLEPDMKRKRQLSKEYRIPEVMNAAQALVGLGVTDVVGADCTRWRRLSNDTATTDQLLAALKAGDFTTVLRNLRTVENRRWDAASGSWHYESKGVSSTDAKALRDRLCVITGICSVVSERILDGAGLRKSERMLKDFGPAC